MVQPCKLQHGTVSTGSAPWSAVPTCVKPRLVRMSAGGCPWKCLGYIAVEASECKTPARDREILWLPWRACSPGGSECYTPKCTGDMNNAVLVGSGSKDGDYGFDT